MGAYLVLALANTAVAPYFSRRVGEYKSSLESEDR
jgi:hypothetical protein